MYRESEIALRKIENLLDRSLNIEDDFLLSALAAHICVLQSGVVETITRETLSEFARVRSDPAVHRHCVRGLNEFQNPKPSKIEDLVSSFGDDVGDKFKLKWDGSSVREHISSIVNQRHQIAHGRNASVTMQTVKSWHESVKAYKRLLGEL